MAACPACGKENPQGFQFCGHCAAPLSATAPIGGAKEVRTLWEGMGARRRIDECDNLIALAGKLTS